MNGTLFINAGYILILLALTVRDILWLRGMFIAAHISFISYALLSNNLSMGTWNMLFMTINIFHLVRILKDRKLIVIPDHLKDLYRDIFSAMSAKEFFYFWQMGNVSQVDGGILVREGERFKQVLLIVDGAVNVAKNGHLLAKLSRGSFIGEMGFLTGGVAFADVEAQGAVGYIAWEQEKLDHIKKVNPGFFVKIQSALGQDLAKKIKTASS